MPYIWLFIAGFIVILLLYGDVRSRHSMFLTPEKAAAIGYNTWPRWREIEPPDNRIRMLWIDKDYVPFVNAGSEICTHQMNLHFMKQPYKYDVWVASPRYPHCTYQSVRCVDIHSPLFYDVLKTTHVLHSNSWVYRRQLLWLSATTGIPYVAWVHTDNYVHLVTQPWMDSRITGRQWTVFNSKSLRSMRPDSLESHTRIVYPTVNYREYVIDKEKHNRMYVTLSNVNENKGGRLLLQLAKALPEFEFLGVIGGYRAQIVYNGLPNLRYIPHTTQIKDVYAQTWVLIMPSKQETWGRTAVEAMSSGIPIVVSATPGLRECCDDAAIYCDRDDLDSWVVTLRKLKENTEFYNQRSTMALARARALDPTADFAGVESWIETQVVPSSVPGRQPNSLEKNLLFR